jgi:hypothetical protein
MHERLSGERGNRLSGRRVGALKLGGGDSDAFVGAGVDWAVGLADEWRRRSCPATPWEGSPSRSRLGEESRLSGRGLGAAQAADGVVHAEGAEEWGWADEWSSPRTAPDSSGRGECPPRPGASPWP